jgi:hypothetical protein
MNRSPINDSHDPMPAPHKKAKGRHVVPHPRRQSKEYPKEKYYSVVNSDMEKFPFGDLSCSTTGGTLLKDDDDSDHVAPVAEELPRFMEDSLTMSNRLDQDEAPVNFQNVPTNDDDSCYDDVLDDEHTNEQPMVQEESQRSLYMLQFSADMSAYEEQSVDGDTSYQEDNTEYQNV